MCPLNSRTSDAILTRASVRAVINLLKESVAGGTRSCFQIFSFTTSNHKPLWSYLQLDTYLNIVTTWKRLQERSIRNEGSSRSNAISNRNAPNQQAQAILKSRDGKSRGPGLAGRTVKNARRCNFNASFVFCDQYHMLPTGFVFCDQNHLGPEIEFEVSLVRHL